MLIRTITSMLLALGALMTAHAQEYPETTYDQDVPKLLDVIGHEHGAMISSAAQITEFMRALAAHDPARMRVESYGETWQGRELTFAVISSAENMARLDAIKADLNTLAQGVRLSNDRLDPTPAVVWLSYGVHGDEITPPDSAFPRIRTSGRTCSRSQASIAPARPNPLWISSAINSTLCSSQMRRASRR